MVVGVRTLFKNLKFLSKILLSERIENTYVIEKMIEEKIIEMTNVNCFPVIKNVEETIQVINEGASLCRFGDGEITLIKGIDIPFQVASKELTDRLTEVLSSNYKNICIAIPKFIFSPKNGLDEWTCNFWKDNGKSFRDVVLKYISLSNIYYSAEVTVASAAYENFDKEKYFKSFRNIWQDKDVTIITGSTVFDKIEYNIFDNAKSVDYVFAPSVNAFESYSEILEKAKLIDKNRIIISILGPTAKIITYDLAKLGYRALDLGHIAKFYDWYKKNKSISENAFDFYAPD